MGRQAPRSLPLTAPRRLWFVDDAMGRLEDGRDILSRGVRVTVGHAVRLIASTRPGRKTQARHGSEQPAAVPSSGKGNGGSRRRGVPAAYGPAS